MTMNLAKEAAAHALGFQTSEAGRLYKHGASYSVMERLEIVEIYFSMTNADGTPPSINKLAKEAKVSWKVAKKVVEEYERSGTVEDRAEMKEKSLSVPGWNLFDEEDELVLLQLRQQDPQRTLASYVYNLHELTGTIVSKSLISRWFKLRFAFKGSMRYTSVVPRDKYKPDNIQRYSDYLALIEQIDTRLAGG